MIVAIPQGERAALSTDEIYIGDLIGCVLVDVAGAEPVIVGEIEDVDRSAGMVAMLVVRGSSSPPSPGKEILIPFAKDYVRKVDVEAKRIEMDLPEGLADLNEPKGNDRE
jgi:16S rRNA processing protein RimM